MFIDINSEDIPTAQLSQTEWRNNVTELKSVYTTKEVDIKATIEAKKKSVIDLKTKNDQKYQKSFIRDDDSKRNADSETLTMLPISSTMTPMKIDQSSMTTKSINVTNISIPFLLHGEPIIAMTNTTLVNLSAPTPINFTTQNITNLTMEIQTTEETLSKGRALNISSPELTNSLYTNITDLSDVSMDEDDKDTEGKYYRKCYCAEKL